MMLALYLLTCPALLARKKKPALNKSRIHYANRHHYSLTKRSNVYLTLSLCIINLYIKVVGGERKFSFFPIVP